MSLLAVFIGSQGTGETAECQALAKRGVTVLSIDNPEPTPACTRQITRRATTALRAGGAVAIDALNASKSDRANWVGLGQGFDVPVLARVIRDPLSVYQDHNAQRPESLRRPPEAVAQTWSDIDALTEEQLLAEDFKHVDDDREEDVGFYAYAAPKIPGEILDVALSDAEILGSMLPSRPPPPGCLEHDVPVAATLRDFSCPTLEERGIPLLPPYRNVDGFPQDLLKLWMTGKVGRCDRCGALVVQLRLFDDSRSPRTGFPTTWTVAWTTAIQHERPPVT